MIIFMRLYPGSLRQKVTLGYLTGLALMFGVALVNWRNLEGVERMVLAGEKVSDLFDTTLEVRRFEKNYFLYGKDEDYAELTGYLGRAEELLGRERDKIGLFAGEDAMDRLGADIENYRGLLMAMHSLRGWESKAIWEERIREKGKAIVSAAEGMSATERRLMQITLRSSGRTLLLSITFLMAAGLAGGIMFYRMFHGPLSELEGHMKKIAGGEFQLIPVRSKDRELVSLSRAFNRMLLELEARKTHLIQSEKLASLGTLLFGVAHELNNPLSNISTSCQILMEEIEGADASYKKELLSQIDGETDRARDIVRSLLDFSRAGKKEEMNLLKAIEESIRFIKAEVPAKVEMSVKVPPDISLYADKQRLQQVFLNLIKNSVEAMEESGRISISARALKDGGGHVDIEFRDTGAGVEPGLLPKIFDPFFTTKEGRKGHGLGLFIVHSIIEEHGGTIDVESAPGHGTAFFIKLPQRGMNKGGDPKMGQRQGE